MKTNEVPQDNGILSKNNARELVYATDDHGNYTTAFSSGWEPKSIALANSIDEINERIALAKIDLKNGIVSPIAYFMELNKMDIGILAGYVGFWKWTVKRHFKPSVFKDLSDHKLQKYADAFNIPLAGLKYFKVD